jgi:hypothetical protein
LSTCSIDERTLESLCEKQIDVDNSTSIIEARRRMLPPKGNSFAHNAAAADESAQHGIRARKWAGRSVHATPHSWA